MTYKHTNQIDDDIPAKVGSPLCSDIAHVHDGLGIIGIHVEDGSVDDASHVRAIWRRTGRTRIRRESNLIVDNDVDGSVGRVIRQVAQVERLVDHTLARECGIAVQKNAHHLQEIKHANQIHDKALYILSFLIPLDLTNVRCGRSESEKHKHACTRVVQI